MSKNYKYVHIIVLLGTSQKHKKQKCYQYIVHFFFFGITIPEYIISTNHEVSSLF